MKISISKFIALAMLIIVPGIASAWGTLDTPATVLSSKKEFASMHAARTPDGKTYVAWLQWSEKEGWGYDLYLQLLDEDGNTMWEDENLAIESQRNTSWTADYSLVVAPNGDAILSWADARSEEDAETAYGHEPVLYRINQQQEYVWAKDGITLGSDYKYPPTLYMIGGELFATLFSSDNNGPQKIVRINEDGSFAFTPKEFRGIITPSEGTDFIGIYSGSNGTEAMRYDRDVNPVWTEAAVISEYVYSGYASNPYSIATDGQGGIAVTFARTLNLVHLPLVNHISGDGEATFGPSIDVIPEENMVGDYDYPIIGLNPDTKLILTLWNHDEGGFGKVGAQLFDYLGERLFGDEGAAFAEKNSPSGYYFSPIAVYPLNENEWFVCYADEQWWKHSILHFACYDNHGNTIWDYASDISSTLSFPYVDFNNGIFTFVCANQETDDNWQTTYMIQTYQFNCKNVSVKEVSDSVGAQSKAYYSISGTRLDRPTKGINIIKNEDGSVSKVIMN